MPCRASRWPPHSSQTLSKSVQAPGLSCPHPRRQISPRFGRATTFSSITRRRISATSCLLTIFIAFPEHVFKLKIFHMRSLFKIICDGLLQYDFIEKVTNRGVALTFVDLGPPIASAWRTLHPSAPVHPRGDEPGRGRRAVQAISVWTRATRHAPEAAVPRDRAADRGSKLSLIAS